MQDGKQFREDYEELNIKDLVWAVLCRWRLLLAAFLAGGILLAAFAAFKDYRVMSNAKTVKDRQTAYETALETYKAQKELLESDLKNFRSEQEWQQYYRKNALMLKIDPYNVSQIAASVHVDWDTADKNAQDPAQTAALLRQYRTAIELLDLDAVIADAGNPDLTAANPAGTERRLLEAETDNENGILSLRIYAQDDKQAEKIYAAAKEALEACHEQLKQESGKHHLTISARSWSGADAGLVDVQTQFRTGLDTVNAYVTSTEKALSALTAPQKTVPTLKSMIRKAVKYGVIGAAAGLVLAAGYLMVKIVLEDRLNSTEEIAQRYSLPLLGTLTSGRKVTKLDRSVSGKLGVDSGRSAEDAAQFIAANIRLYMKDGGKLVLAGTCGEEKLNALKETLAPLLDGIELSTAGNINESAAAVGALQENDAVICAEQWKKAAHKEIRRELQTVSDSGTRNLGLIVLC